MAGLFRMGSVSWISVLFPYLLAVFKVTCVQHSTAAPRNLPFWKVGTELLEQLHAHLSALGREC